MKISSPSTEDDVRRVKPLANIGMSRSTLDNVNLQGTEEMREKKRSVKKKKLSPVKVDG